MMFGRFIYFHQTVCILRLIGVLIPHVEIPRKKERMVVANMRQRRVAGISKPMIANINNSQSANKKKFILFLLIHLFGITT